MTDKKEIKRRFKETPPDMGVFAIRNLSNGKSLVASSPDLHAALNSHRFRLKAGMHENRDLQKDFSEAGESNFAFEVLDRLKPKDDPGFDAAAELKVLESLWLEKLTPYGERGYHRNP
ncbi:MAG: GIY-YIG nuclease family protein [Planctomycetes bacterium]|nr:GIY-YIG nuclease family protein [Planctomycetota bacterium]